jgi:hypothetical protein
MNPSMKENINICTRKFGEGKKNKKNRWMKPEIILTWFTELRNHDESTSKEEYVRIHKDDPTTKKALILF